MDLHKKHCTCANDDLGLCSCTSSSPPPESPPFSPVPNSIGKKVVAVVPVHGRHPLLKHTIERLLNKNGCTAVICAGSESDRKTCEDAGARFILSSNRFLGEKWNACFLKARTFNPDAVLFVGSSDWVSDQWVPTLMKHLSKDVWMVGKAGCYMLDITTKPPSSYSKWYRPSVPISYRLLYWPGYKFGSEKGSTHFRLNESIGIGRLISKEGLESVDWKPFHPQLVNSLDYNMYKKFKSKSKIVYDNSIHSMGISTDQWPNKHTFEMHWNNTYPSKRILNPLNFLKQHFSEYNKIF